LIFKTLDKGHGRVEERQIAVINSLDWFQRHSEWMDLTSMVEVTSTRLWKGKKTIEKRYYISSKEYSAVDAGLAIRSHWSIENHLHWSMDIIFIEDASLANAGHAAENLAMFRRLRMSL
jgi:hypothetical protein